VNRFEEVTLITTRADSARYRGHNGCDHQGLPVTPPQARVLTEIRRYFVANSEQGCRIAELSRRLSLGYNVTRAHVNALDRKGWIRWSSSKGQVGKHLVIPRR
jgi:hypothetical protein